MFPASLLLLLAVISCVHCGLELTQPSILNIKPGESLVIDCKVSGYSLTDRSNMFGVAWVRQSEGGSPEWITTIYYDADIRSKDSLKQKFSVTRDTSTGTVTLTGKSLQTDDAAVYYCARYHCVQTSPKALQKP
ncbi:hypothetical protein UPYG_G00104680 [Umbra pygmaea]|uniref:Ig-like domain-containing protein n=1 Tax=Umbra pygmaea TaxID=75934 RepID=A0ABD0XLW5_UMBPY